MYVVTYIIWGLSLLYALLCCFRILMWLSYTFLWMYLYYTLTVNFDWWFHVSLFGYSWRDWILGATLPRSCLSRITQGYELWLIWYHSPRVFSSVYLGDIYVLDCFYWWAPMLYIIISKENLFVNLFRRIFKFELCARRY